VRHWRVWRSYFMKFYWNSLYLPFQVQHVVISNAIFLYSITLSDAAFVVLPFRSVLMSVTYALINYFAIRFEIMYPANCQSVGCTVDNRFLAREANVQRRQYRSPSLGMSWASSVHLRKMRYVFPGSVFSLFSCLPLGENFLRSFPRTFSRHLLFPN
jgi:hypothetical protein